MPKIKNNNLEIYRHSLAHILMQALERMYGAVPGVGPAIENGFYHDFDCKKQITEQDLPKIEEEMKEIIKENLPIKRKIMKIDQGIELLKKKKFIYTAEIAKNLKKQGEKNISFYKQGNFINMCRGPHLSSTGEIDPQSFELTKIAGVYWKNNEKNKMIQRIYGVSFNNKKELKKYFKILEEAEKRDHRKLGKELKLFLIDPDVGLGLPMWLPKGAMLWRIMEDFWYQEHLKNGYELVRSPHIGSKKLWEKSGHWNFYNESMYPPMEVGQSLEDAQAGKKVKVKEEYLIKPMNCPFHVTLYNSQQHSYRELPLRWAECGTVYRYEKSGELSGLTRVRGFTQDDAHIICTKKQAEQELKKVLDFIIFIFKSFGFNDYKVYLSVRDPKNNKYAGTKEGWDFTEKALEKVAKEKGLDYEKDIGGAVFYGPKLDFKVKDCLGREWQCSTLQYDFNLPEKFKMNFINEKGEKERPYMLHRALFGSFERFIGILIEHYAGAFPLWLSPLQVKIISVSEKHIKYCEELANKLRKENIRVKVDDSNETVGNKIRKAITEKIPYMAVIGDKEIKSKKINIRDYGLKQTREISLEKFIKEVLEKIEKKK
ncbi:MAG: threonine--tRNA ligase [Xanthomonadaceae bacterium]|nr:threonine--tRNA ligase [Rhodospirillaceae bacterium]NIA18204.1 threonine--tRNA ligase [Xanthomonadaceae bacterium]